MENKKEPLMSAPEWYKKQKKYLPNDVYAQYYAQYHTQWHLNNAKEFVADEAETGSFQYEFGRFKIVVNKQSIHTAIDNYIEINLNKEL